MGGGGGGAARCVSGNCRHLQVEFVHLREFPKRRFNGTGSCLGYDLDSSCIVGFVLTNVPIILPENSVLRCLRG